MRYPIQRRWIWSITLIITLILGVILVFNHAAIRILDGEILNIHKTAMDFLQQSIDRRLVELEHISIELEINKQNIALKKTAAGEKFYDEDTYRFVELFQNAQIANEFIEDIYIYYPRARQVVGAKGSFEMKGYYLLSNQLKETNYERWVTILQNTQNRNFVMSQTDDAVPEMYFVHQLPEAESTGEPAAVLVARVNRDAVLRASGLVVSHHPQTLMSILDENGLEYARLGDETLAPVMQEILGEYRQKGAEGIAAQHPEHVLTVAASPQTGLHYLILSQTDALLTAPKRVTQFSYLVILGCLVLGVILSFVVSHRHHKPLVHLAAQLPAPENGEEQSLDYGYIEQCVANLLHQNAQSIQKSEELGWVLKDRFLNELIATAQEDEAILVSMATFYGICFEAVRYRLALYLLPEALGGQGKQALFGALRQAAERFEAGGNCLAVPALVQGRVVVLLNYESAEEADPGRLTECLAQALGAPLTAACSEEFESEGQILTAYEQTLQRMEVSIAGSGIGDASGQPPVYKEGSESRAVFTRWKKSLERHEYGLAAQLTGPVFAGYVLSPVDPYVARSRKYTVVNALLEVLQQENLRHGLFAKNDFVRALSGCETPAALEAQTTRLLVQLDKASGTYSDHRRNQLAQRIRAIIDENYTQSYLGLYYISDAMKVSTTYISKVFKKEFGLGITDYINQKRIDRAKHLIAQKQLAIKEVALQVGFTSDIHFIRVFKKYENTTPGAYQRKDGEA